MRYWVENQELLTPSQSGFRKEMSCTDNITKLKLEIEHSINNKKHVLAVFLDISDAFPNVQSLILLLISTEKGFSRKVFKFVKFWTDHSHIHSEINLDSPKNYKFLVQGGFYRGGVFSPLLYIIYVSGIFNELGENIKDLQFADDVVLYHGRFRYRQNHF